MNYSRGEIVVKRLSQGLGSLFLHTAPGGCLLLCAALLFSSFEVFALPKLIGDLNEDGQADVLDVVRLMNFLNGSNSIPAAQGIQLSDNSPYPSLPALYADINEDGVIDQKDVQLLEQAILGISELPNPTAPPTLPSYPGSTNGPLLSIKGSSQPGRIITISGDFTVIVTNTGLNGDFNVNFPIASNRLNRIYVSSGSDKFGAGTPQVIEIVHDAEAPNLYIDFPTPSSEIITNSIIVAGRVGDMLSGYRGLQVYVTNRTILTNTTAEAIALRGQAGGEAIVDVGIGNNGTFARIGVPVVLGFNEIEVTAVDVLGNRRVRTAQIVRLDPTGKPQMIVLSGDGQATNVHLRLPQPIRVKILKADGSPFARKFVTFDVTRSDGRLTSSSTDTNAGELMYQVETDAQGIAQAWWTLGGDAGCGNNRVCASSRDIAGCGYFCASAFPAPASQINIGAGNNQKVETGGQPAETLRAWVNDSCNGVANVAVTFVVTQGGGKVRAVGSQDPWGPVLRVRTGITGHAAVEFQAGPDAGLNTVEANFLSNRFLPATFTVYGVARDAAKPTSFSGLVLDNTSRPIGAAQCLLTVNAKDYRTATDVQGRFRFENIESGRAHLYVNGQTATTLYTNQIRKGSFPALSYMHTLVPNAENSLTTPVLLPRLNTNNIRSYYGTNDVELTCEGMEGLKMRVKAGSLKRLADGSVPVNGQEIPISLNQVHHDQIPMPIPDGASPPFAWTLQPGGAVFDPPIEIEYPNMSGLPAGSIAYFLSFNHDTERFEIISSGHVTADASTIVTDVGSGLTLAGWGCNCPPYSVTGDCESCSTTCNERGSLSGGSVSTGKSTVKLCEEMTFTVSGVSDSGGSQKKVCKKAGTTLISISPGSPKYTWKVLRDDRVVASGRGATAKAIAEHEGSYSCEFEASVERECPPSPISIKSSGKTEVEKSLWEDAEVALAITAPDELKKKINSAINKIPGVNVELKEVSGAFTSKSRPCCKNGVVDPKGERYKEGSMGLSADLKGIKIWGPPAISREFDFTFAIIQVDFNVGVSLDSDFSITGTVGKRWDDCTPEECWYGSFGGDISLTPAVTIEAIACLETFWTSKECVGVDITPLSFPIKLGGSLGYNTRTACSGFKGEFKLFSIDFKANCKVNGVGIQFSYPIYGGL